MQYWRMQLHPSESEAAARHAIESLAAGFIGLDFPEDMGDLTLAERASLPPGQADYWDFANRMDVGDRVLIIVHHYPFALATVADSYNYVRRIAPELGVWFRHFRRVDNVQYYADKVTNAAEWERIVMTDTISILTDPESKSHRLINSW